MRKQFLPMFLCFAMIFCTFVCPEYAKAAGGIYENAPYLLNAVGVIDAPDTDIEILDGALLRYETARLAVGLIGGKDTAKGYIGDGSFSDVGEKSICADYIYYAKKCGIVSGYGNYYRPKNETTYAEFIKTVVSILGYDLRAEYEGGYPAGYIKVAAVLGINIGKGADDTITRREAYHIAFLALETDVMKTNTIGDKTDYKIEKGENLLNIYLNAETAEGIITGNGTTGIYSKTPSSDTTIMLDGKAYQTDRINQRRFLGFDSVVYIKKDTNKVLYIRESDSNTLYSVKSDFISANTTKKSFKYYTDEQKTKEKSIRLGDNTSVIYNEVFLGKLYTSDVAADDLMPDSGHIDLLDNDADGTADIVFISDYKSYAVSHSSQTNQKIYVKGNTVTELDINDNVRVIDARGNDFDYTALAEWDVVSVLGSRDYYTKDGEAAVIAVIKNSVRGIVNETSEDTAVIDGEEYGVAKNFYDEGYYFELGRNGSFYFDAENKITACDYSDKKEDYGYLIDAHISEKNPKLLMLKIFTKNGRVEDYTAEGKIKFSQGGAETRDDAYKLIAKFTKADGTATDNQLIMYSLNEDKTIKSISKYSDTPSYNVFSKSFSGDGVHYVARRFGGKYYLSAADTKIFSIPDRSDDYKNYQLLTPTSIETDKKYDGVEIYDADEDNFAGAVIMKEKNAAGVAGTSRIMLVEKVSAALNGSDDLTTLVTGLFNGKETRVTAEETGLVTLSGNNGVWGYSGVALENLKKGDIIQYALNPSGEIKKFRILFRPDSSADSFYKNGNDTVPTDRILSNELTVMYNKVVRCSATAAILDSDNEKGVNFKGDRFNLIVYIYDGKKNEIYIGSKGDIVPGDMAFMTFDYASPKEMVIYRYAD